MKDKLFRDEKSGAQHGTTQWSMNVTGCSNAKKGPHKAFNAYSEFTDKELDSQIAAIAMDHFQMSNFEGE